MKQNALHPVTALALLSLLWGSSAAAQAEALQGRVEAFEDGAAHSLDHAKDLAAQITELPDGEEKNALQSRLRAATDAAFTATRPRPRPRTLEEGAMSANLSEAAALDQGIAAYRGDDLAQAAARLTAFRAAYPGSESYGRASYFLGLTEARRGDSRAAAQAFLDSITAAPQGSEAPLATLRLGLSLATLGKTEAACGSFEALQHRFPAAPQAQEAAALLSELDC